MVTMETLYPGKRFRYERMDPPEARCPHCGRQYEDCSHVNNFERAEARKRCKEQNERA